MRAVPRSALVEGTIERLKSQIVSGKWPIGSKIPIEDELVEELQVSRSTLRQAVQALVYVGLLETAQAGGRSFAARTEADGRAPGDAVPTGDSHDNDRRHNSNTRERRVMTQQWVAGFRTAVISPYEKIQLTEPRGFNGQTVRQILRMAGGGERLRVRLSNRYGRSP